MDPFDQFWSEYPRRQAKKDARKAWVQGQCDDHLDAILKALHWQRTCEQWLRGFIPLPATYLRGERWDDEPDRPTLSASSARTLGAIYDQRH